MSGPGQDKAAARLRGPQVNMQLAARTREEAPSSLPGQQVGLCHPEPSRRPSEWWQPGLEAINLNCPGQLTQTSSKERNSSLSLLLCTFLWLAEAWLEHSVFYPGPAHAHSSAYCPFCWTFPWTNMAGKHGFKFFLLYTCSQENITQKLHMGRITLSWTEKAGKTISHLHRNK